MASCIKLKLVFLDFKAHRFQKAFDLMSLKLLNLVLEFWVFSKHFVK